MELQNLTQIRIHFRKNILLYSSNYELRAFDKFKKNPKIANDLIKSMQLNLKNYLFFHSLCFLKYREAIDLYNKEFLSAIKDKSYEKSKINDVTRIILLFFPHILKSSNLHKQVSDIENFDYKNFNLEDNSTPKRNSTQNSQDDLETTIRNFFEHYEILNKERGFLFHRREMIFYMESFLINYTANETKKMTDEERNDMFLLHYFRPFLKPEDYFTKTNSNSKEFELS
jgi:hypothetical protein